MSVSFSLYFYIYLFFFPSTLSVQSNHDGRVDIHREVDQKRVKQGENSSRMDIQRLEERLQAEREERGRLELEMEKLKRERAILEEQRERERGKSFSLLALHLQLVNEDRFSSSRIKQYIT